ncbi:hypothetical protein A9Q81_08635 [Gammaproteobacteria bacterium 42_54_T18]|nr:hypothetical protein A9Q81_08635 [Gammaproteobacteria bacterium 42_54_T18]
MEGLQQLLFIGLESAQYFIDPQKRIYWLYLLSSAVIAFGLGMARREHLPRQLAKALSWKLWLHPSSRIDFYWFFLNHILRVALVVPVLGGGVALAITINRILYRWFGAGDFWQLPEMTVTVLFTLVLFLVEDFSRFFVHYLYHKVPLFWRFHAIHHSATILTPMTLYRIHWAEMLVNSIRSLLVIGFVSAMFIYFFDNGIHPYTVFGATITGFLFNMAGSNLRHSSVWLGFGYFERWVVSPAQHQIHHSVAPEHIDKNFGATLAVWDRLFGSLTMSQHTKVEGYGLAGKAVEQRFLSQQRGL